MAVTRKRTRTKTSSRTRKPASKSSRTAKRSSKRGGRRGGSKFQYKRRSAEDYKRHRDESSGNFDAYIKDGIPKFKPRDGKNQIRIMPPTFEEADDFAYTLLVHYGIGADEQTYLCRKMLGPDEECAICNEHDKLVAEGESEDAQHFKSKKRKMIWLLDRKDAEAGPSVWPMPFGTWKDVMLACEDEEGEILALDHPDEGHDVLFTKEGQGRRTKYVGVKLGKERRLLDDEDEMQEVLAYIQEHPLDDTLNFFENDYLEAVLAGQKSRGDDDDDDDDDDRPRRRKSKPKRSAKSSRSRRDEEDEDEEDEDDEDLDEDEDDDDDVDDDEDVDDEDEDEDLDEEDEDEDLDEEDEDYDEEDDDVDDEDEDVDEEDDEEDEEPPRRSRKRSSANAKLKAAASRAKKKPARKRSR